MQKTNAHPADSTLEKLQKPSQPENSVSTVAVATPPSAAKPGLEVESPSMNKRASQDEPPSNVSNNQALPLKRAKAAQKAVKILPAKYEACEVEDMVVLIANMISELIETNDELPLRSGVLTRFHSR
jgi:hypothetical protein